MLNLFSLLCWYFDVFLGEKGQKEQSKLQGSLGNVPEQNSVTAI